MKKVLIFGSTGSIGKQSLEVLQAFPGHFKLSHLTAYKNAELLSEQAKISKAKKHLGPLNDSVIKEFISEADLIINALPGFEGLRVSIQVLKAGKTLLSANKESLAIAGRHLLKIARENGAEIRPLDSEASAIWQLIGEHGRENLKSVTLTCSGGPFFGKTTQDLKEATIVDALNHPTWKMGAKVTIDSATLINKVLEVYEVSELFQIPLEQIQIVVHRQSVVHSMIHTKTGGTKMHITQNDMRLPISYALNFPWQPPCPWPIQRTKKSELSFDAVDKKTFRSIHWLDLHKGNPNFPIALNALNEIAVNKFLNGEIPFLGIYEFIESRMEKWLYKVPPQTLEEIISLHQKISTHEHSHPLSSRELNPSQAR